MFCESDPGMEIKLVICRCPPKALFPQKVWKVRKKLKRRSFQNMSKFPPWAFGKFRQNVGPEMCRAKSVRQNAGHSKKCPRKFPAKCCTHQRCPRNFPKMCPRKKSGQKGPKNPQSVHESEKCPKSVQKNPHNVHESKTFTKSTQSGQKVSKKCTKIVPQVSKKVST